MDVVTRPAVRWTAGLLVLCSSVAWSADTPIYCGTTQWQAFIDEAASRFTISSQWLDAIIRAESAGCEAMGGHPTTSAAGAMGLMQLMPTTWERFRQRLTLGTNAYDPHDNILAGAAYVRELYDRYGWVGASAAYHAGPARYDGYLKSGRPLPGATLQYLARINRSLGRMNADFPSSSVTDATIPIANRELFVAHKASAAATDGLFVALRHDKHHADSKTPEPSDVQHK